MNDLTFLFLLIPALVLSVGAIAMWMTLRWLQRFRRETFGEFAAPLYAPLLPFSSKARTQYYSPAGSDTSGSYSHDSGASGSSWTHHSPGSGDHGHHGHGPSGHDFGFSSHGHDSGFGHSHDSGSSGGDYSSSSSSDSGSGSFSGDSGSSSW